MILQRAHTSRDILYIYIFTLQNSLLRFLKTISGPEIKIVDFMAPCPNFQGNAMEIPHQQKDTNPINSLHKNHYTEKWNIPLNEQSWYTNDFVQM